MSKQIDVTDLIPSSLKTASRDFVDSEYRDRNLQDTLPPIRTRYEAYGKLSEGIVNVTGAMDGVKAGMRDCLKALNGSDVVFTQSAESTYSSLLDALMAVAEMAVQTLNCIYKMEDVIAANPPPLVAMAEEEDEPAENIDDEDLPETEDEEEDI